MLTIFSAPRAFTGPAANAQKNAILSWGQLGEDVEIILCGDEYGIDEICRQLGIKNIPGIARNEYGTPLLNDMFAKAENRASHQIMGYVNCDIIFASNIFSLIEKIQHKKFLLIGRKRDVDIQEEIDFCDELWKEWLARRFKRNGIMGPPQAIEYFFYPKGHLGMLPPFVVGRPGWDNWLIAEAIRRKFEIFDASEVIIAYHQNHTYDHIPMRRGNFAWGPEAESNQKIFMKSTGWLPLFTIKNASHVITGEGHVHDQEMRFRDRLAVWVLRNRVLTRWHYRLKLLSKPRKLLQAVKKELRKL